MKKINLFLIVFTFVIYSTFAYSNNDFNEWKITFKKYALKQGISPETLNNLIDKSIFLKEKLHILRVKNYLPLLCPFVEGW